MVEDVEERVLGLCLAGQLLDVVDDEDVDALVEAEELIDVSARSLGRGVLSLKIACGDVEHTPAGIVLGKFQSQALQKVRLAAAGGPEDIQRVERGLFGAPYDCVDDFAGYLVAVAAQIAVEAEPRV